jgi:site-specific recombinase XerD
VHYHYKNTAEHVEYGTLRTLLKRLFLRAGLRKPFHPHIFRRHSRATHVLANGLMTDAQARQYFGWSAASNMLATYSHLVDTDVHQAVLRENNLASPTVAHDTLTPQPCPLYCA